MVKRLRHRPFTAVTGVQIPLESLRRSSQVVRQWSATPVSTGSNPVCASKKVLKYQNFFFGVWIQKKRAIHELKLVCVSLFFVFC